MTPALIQRAQCSLYAAMENGSSFLSSPPPSTPAFLARVHCHRSPQPDVAWWLWIENLWGLRLSLPDALSSSAGSSPSELAGSGFSRTSSVPSQGQRPWGVLTAHQARIKSFHYRMKISSAQPIMAFLFSFSFFLNHKIQGK